MRKVFLAAALMILAAFGSGARPLANETAQAGDAASGGKEMQAKTVHDFTMKTIDGAETSLSVYAGKALLIVNTASKCGFTPQYEAIEKLYETYKARGFEVLAFPANNFMNQEPGTNEEIREFCSTKFHVTFPLFEKISVKGKDIHPLYQHLTGRPGLEGEIKWNFNKFLVDPKGRVVARFDSPTAPLSKQITEKLESILPVPAVSTAK